MTQLRAAQNRSEQARVIREAKPAAPVHRGGAHKGVTTGRRTADPMEPVTIQLPGDLITAVDGMIPDVGKTRSEVIRFLMRKALGQ